MDFMKKAYKLAKKASYTTYPNPMVGAVIVNQNKIIGRGYHKSYGLNHAEKNAIEDAYESGYGSLLEGSTMYVTLEPCNHYGKTPPCVDLILKEKISALHISQVDVNPQMQGRSVEILENHGIEVKTGYMADYGKRLNRKFVNRFESDLPYISLKTATSLDGKIASKNYDSKWITCEASRKRVHLLRKHNEGILTSYKTANMDKAKLNIRYVEADKNPIPIIIDRNLNTNIELELFDIHEKVLIVTSAKNIDSKDKIEFYDAKNKALVEYIYVDENESKLDIKCALKQIKKLGIHAVMIEAGGEMAWEMLKLDLVDEIYMFIAPIIIGGKDAISVVSGDGFGKISESLRFEFDELEFIGTDILIRGRRICSQV